MAKIDSGAKTSAMHASNIETFEPRRPDWLRFNATGLAASKSAQTIM